MNIYYINLDRSPERREKIESCLNKYDLQYRRVRAVDANDLSENEISTCHDPKYNPYGYFSNLKKAEIACFLSHKKALQEFLSTSQDEFVVILEDDAEFICDPKPVFRAIENKIKAACEPILIKLFSRRDNKTSSLINLTPEIELAVPVVCPLNTSAQIFNRSGALQFLESTDRICLPIDVRLQFADDMPLLVLQTRPNLVRGFAEEVGGSTIAQTNNTHIFNKLAREIRRAMFRLRISLRSRIRNQQSPAQIHLSILR
jgi:GR25 family glycosyltransferase involved in LPS biosynthesis